MTALLLVVGIVLEQLVPWVFHRWGPALHSSALKTALILQVLAAVFAFFGHGAVMEVILGTAAVSLGWTALSYLAYRRSIKDAVIAVQARKHKQSE